MIKILKKLRKEKGLYLIVTELDAKAADIITEYEKDVIDYRLEEHLIELSDHVDNDMVIKRLKDFLIESVFTHYVDMVSILNYIHTMRNVIKVEKKHPSHSKFIFVIEFKNYKGDQSNNDEDTDEDDEGDFFGLSFKTKLLDKKNLSPIEVMLFHSLTDLYEGNILVAKPKEVKIYLEEKETSGKVEEFLNLNIRFFK